MKKLFLIGLMIVAAAGFTRAQQATFENDGTITTPTNIDAVTFINNGAFDIAFNSISVTSGGSLGAFFITSQEAPFDFSDVLYYTNRGTMSCDTGFTFDLAPATTGVRTNSASFGNGNIGKIYCGSAFNSGLTTSNGNTILVFFTGFGVSLSGVPLLQIRATNIVNSGYLDVGVDGVVDMRGSSLNLARGTVHVEGFDETNIFSTVSSIGIDDVYWGFGMQTNQLNTNNLSLPLAHSPVNNVTNAAGGASISFVMPFPYSVAYANVTSFNPSNVLTQVVYINTNLQNIATDVRFEGLIPTIQWAGTVTNYNGVFGPTVTTNYLYLQDYYGAQQTNYLITNQYTFSGAPQPQPFNYQFSRGFDPNFSLFQAGNTNFSTALYSNAFTTTNGNYGETNAYAAYGVQLAPVSSFPDPTLPDSNVTNVPGRIQINATSSLDLTRSQITGANYLNLTSPNHFVGATNATIIAPYMDINLGSTNGLLNISNVVAPSTPRFSGPIDMYSARWTNVNNGFTNTYHVLIVNAQISPISLSQVVNCSLRAPTVTISDALNIQNSLLINANNLLITSNSPFGATPYGEINVLSGDILWSSSLPVLQSVTNFGLISVGNAAYFENIQTLPYYASNSVAPYTTFVNHGLVSSSGNLTWANYFENTGGGLIITNYSNITTTSNQSALIYSAVGPFKLQAGPALMLNGGIAAPSGDLSITASSLTISNHSLLTSGELTLTVSGVLTDTGVQSSNFWSVGDGMNLSVKPSSGDLLGTTITNTAPGGVEVFNTWAGTDEGASSSGYANNAAVGHLILDGGDDSSQFYFGGPDNSGRYALYVDLLELRDGATNRESVNGVETFTTFDVAPNMTVYYSDAVLEGGVDISEKLNGADGGHLVWVPGYAGAFSSTNIAYPGGATYAFNRALAQSTDIDSNGNGLANAFDPSPFFVPQNVNFSFRMTNRPVKMPVLSWNSLANSTNYLYFSTSLTGTNWTAITNFVQGPADGIVTFMDRGWSNHAAGFYKVQMTPQQP